MAYLRLSSYATLALRHLINNRRLALINVGGLTLGLSVFLFSILLVRYETQHDHMFEHYDNTYVVSGVFADTSGEPISEYPETRSVYGPLIDVEIEELIRVARSKVEEHLLSSEHAQLYLGLRFVDPDFTRIFDFHYIFGDETAIDRPDALIVTESTAQKLFGQVDVVGRQVKINNRYPASIGAVIEDIPRDSHFNTDFRPNHELTAIATTTLLSRISEFKLKGDWKGDWAMTYVLLPAEKQLAWLQNELDQVYEKTTPAETREYLGGLRARPLNEANIIIWDSLGFPLLATVRLLGLMILLIACLNYINLATVQNSARLREIGLRKTFGARNSHVMFQFLLESIFITAFSMLLAVACIELAVPIFNGWTNKILSLDYPHLLPLIFVSTLSIGLCAGIYPAYAISRSPTLAVLRGQAFQPRSASFLRSVMVCGQFAMTVFILSLVMVIFFQNNKLHQLGNVYPKSNIVVLDHVGDPKIREKHPQLRHALLAIENVEAVSFSNTVPYLDESLSLLATQQDGREASFEINVVSIDQDFFTAYEIPLIRGQTPAQQIKNDYGQVVINESAAKLFPNSQLGARFRMQPLTENSRSADFEIMGVVPDQYFRGVHTNIRPTAFFVDNTKFQYISVRIKNTSDEDTLQEIDEAWSQLIKEHPIQRHLLDDYFNYFFRIPRMINQLVALFALIALSLAMTGLFGLSTFLVHRRTKEIGMRKVLGASASQIGRLLAWQFLQPVLWAIVIATPLAYLASDIYLDFFPERIPSALPCIALASLLCLLVAGTVIALHASRVARQMPARSLQSERAFY